MRTLKELTKDAHKSAERSVFMQRLIGRDITPLQYYTYLCNQLFMYTALEQYANDLGIFEDDLLSLPRMESIYADVMEMYVKNNFTAATILKSSYQYVEHLEKISTDKQKIFSHIYVRHMGDLSGGQIISKMVPGPTKLYEFDGDVNLLKDAVRNKLTPDLADEAKICFNLIQNFLEELEYHFGSMESLNTTSR